MTIFALGIRSVISYGNDVMSTFVLEAVNVQSWCVLVSSAGAITPSLRLLKWSAHLVMLCSDRVL